MQARDLLSADINGKSDPYVRNFLSTVFSMILFHKFSLTPLKVRVLFYTSATAEAEEILKTDKQRSTLNPNWYERADDKEDLIRSVTMNHESFLLFKLFDWDRVGGHDPLYVPKEES
jgi:Ca2+-dependent lipid-binding protein